jgi:hypothetical protein
MEDVSDVDDSPELKGFAKLTAMLIHAGRCQGLVRYEDGVYGTICADQVVQGHLLKYADAHRFISSVLESEPTYHAGDWTSKLLKWFATQPHPDFPILWPDEMNTTTIAFLDGQLNTSTMRFTARSSLSEAGLHAMSMQNQQNDLDGLGKTFNQTCPRENDYTGSSDNDNIVEDAHIVMDDNVKLIPQRLSAMDMMMKASREATADTFDLNKSRRQRGAYQGPV